MIVFCLTFFPQSRGRHCLEVVHVSEKFSSPLMQSISLILLKSCIVMDGICVFLLLRIFLKEWPWMSVLETSNMGSYTLNQRRNSSKPDIVTAFENTYKTSFAELVGYLLEIFCQPFIIKFIHSCVTAAVNLVILMSIKPCWTEDKVRLELNQAIKNMLCKLFPPIWCWGISWFYWYV